MQCPACRHENPPGSKFCLECGGRLAVRCPACGAEVPGGAKFCNHCGAPVTAQVSNVSPRFSAPESYTPKHLAERILTSKASLEGERKQVTVLFADLKGSMELLADRDPEEARKILDPVLELMMEAVHRYEGTVNQVMGDGIMALFGAPLAHEDHAVRACYAALRLQESVKRYADDARHAHGVNVQIRIGVNSGEVVVRAVGSDLHMDYTAVGQTTHLAARMEQLASPGSILVTPATLALVEGFVDVRSLGPVPVKGLADAVEVYEVTGAGPARTRLQATARRGLTRFVGRDDDLAQLRRVQQLASNGHGQAAAIVGEAGVGKSRLVYEFTHSHRLHGWLVLEAASVSYGKATSYLPVIDLLKSYFKIHDRDDVREIREKVTGKLLTLDRALEPTLPALLSLLDVPVDDEAWRALEPAQRRQRTLDAVKRLLLREAREQPLVVIFEDLHWIDSETQALLDGLLDSLGSARLLLLVNYRPEYQHSWASKTHYSQMRLDALPAESAAELLDAILGDGSGLVSLKQLLVKRGNPFFLEETVRMLVEMKALAGERGRYRLTQPIQTVQVPSTVQTILAARIDRLVPEDKRLLQVASVVGKDVPFGLLAAIAESPDEALRRGLNHLQAAEFLYETGLYPDHEYSFKHALTHEVTYGGLLQERRRELHARLVSAIEELYRNRLTEQVDRLAHHAFRGEEWDKALTYSRQAGARGAVRSAYREAAACYNQALLAVQHLPRSRATLELMIDLRFDVRNALWPLGELAQILDHLREAKALAEAVADRGRLGRIASYMTQHFLATGDYERAVESGQEALALASALGDLPLQVVASLFLSQGYFSLGNWVRATELLRANVEALQGDRAHERYGATGVPSVMSRTWLVWCLAELGEFVEAIRHAHEGLRIAEAVGQTFSIVHIDIGVGRLYVRKGEPHQAIPGLERAVELCEAQGIPLLLPQGLGTLGYAYALVGRLNEAIPVLKKAVEAVLPRERSLRLGWLGEACLLADRVEEAHQSTLRALEVSRTQKEKGHEAWALRLLGDIATHPDRFDAETGEAHYREALALAEPRGMRPLVAHCHSGLAKLYRRAGKRIDPDEHFATATTMYREMGMTYWLEQVEAELNELG